MSSELRLIELLVLVEGKTEEKFVNSILKEHLAPLGIIAKPRCVSDGRGGGSSWGKWHNIMRGLIGSNSKATIRFTTMFDLYALPHDFPGHKQHKYINDTNERTDHLEAALAETFDNTPRLIPYIQRHEFEALVLAGIDTPGIIMDNQDQAAGIKQLQREIADLAPEDINGDRESAPSKRLIRHIRGYQKIIHGLDVVRVTGLPRLRSRCPRFNRWLARLEALASADAFGPMPSGSI